MRYDAIFEWKMTPAEAEVFKLAVLYEREFLRIFKNQPQLDGQGYRRNTIPKRGDPRKSNLFRHCWKLRRETRGLLQEHEYERYIQANFYILRLNHAHVEPNAVCGDKAWVRWRVWERRRKRKEEELASKEPAPSANTTDPKLMRDLDRTKKFLYEKFEGEPTVEKLKRFVDDGIFRLWVGMGKINPSYIVLSPWVRQSTDIGKVCRECYLDPLLLQERITDAVQQYFKEEYKHEF